MATAKEPATKITVAQARKKIETLEEKVRSLKDGAWCYLCDTHKSKDGFYMSTDPMNKSGLTPICKECTRKIVFKVGKDGVEHEPDKESVRLALRYLNKPCLEKVWDSSIQETENLASGKVKSNVWNAYIRQISMGQYNTLTYADSDGLQIDLKKQINESKKDSENIVKEKNQEILEQYKMNRMDNPFYWI